MSTHGAKKELRHQIAQTLTTTFEELKKGTDLKKFEKSIKKASKILVEGFRPEEKKTVQKKAAPAKSTQKEATPVPAVKASKVVKATKTTQRAGAAKAVKPKSPVARKVKKA